MPRGMPWLKLWEEDLKRDCAVLSPSARGIWVWIFLNLRHHHGRRKLSLSEWARVACASRRECLSAVREMALHRTADVEPVELTGKGEQEISIACRRIIKEEGLRTRTLARVRKYRERHRERDMSVTCNASTQKRNGVGMHELDASIVDGNDVTACNAAVTTNVTEMYGGRSKKHTSLEAEAPTSQPGDMNKTGEDSHIAGRRRNGGSGATALQDRFARFWLAYPRHEPSRLKAWISFRRIAPNKDTLGAMLSWIERAKRTEQWSDRTLIPHATTWLNGRYWEGDVPPERATLRPDQGRVVERCHCGAPIVDIAGIVHDPAWCHQVP